MTKVKICGITRLADARCAAEAGTDMLGFIFYPKSKRYITPSQAGAITEAVREAFGDAAPLMVGVFVDAPLHVVRITAARAGLDLIQMHGDEPPQTIAALAPRAFKAVGPGTQQEAEQMLELYGGRPAASDKAPPRPDLAMDAFAPVARGGTGERADVDIARWLADRCRLLLAGGLSPENVAEAIRQVRPWGVDVSSGVEDRSVADGAPCRKDHTLIRAFIEAVRTADASLAS